MHRHAFGESFRYKCGSSPCCAVFVLIPMMEAGCDTHVYVRSCSMSVSVMDGHMSRVFALVYHPSDPQILVSAGWDDTVQVGIFWLYTSFVCL